MEPVGRGSEMQRLEAFLAGAVNDGAALLLSGEPGVGKTLLLDTVAEIASQQGVRVLRAAGAQFEAGVSFAGLHQVLQPLKSDMADLDPYQGAALSTALGMAEGPPPDQLTVCSASLALLQHMARRSPLLVIIDDVPWLDRPSAIVLGFVARRLSGSHVGLLTAARPGQESYFDRYSIPNLTVGPLDDAAGEELLTSRYPALAAPVRRRLLAEAEGNPLALLELPAALSIAQRAGNLPAVLPLGQRLQSLFAGRIHDLPEVTRHILLLAALESSGDLEVLQAAATTAKPPSDISALAPAERIHLVAVDDRAGVVSFRHPLTRSAVVELATSEERRSAHRVIAEQLGDHPERRAWHMAEATVGVDETCAALLEQAATRILARGDAVGAVAALTRAAELSPPGPARGRRFAEAAFAGAGVTGELEDAARLLADAHNADPHVKDSFQAAVTAAFVLVNGDGDIDTAHRLIVGALEDGEPVSDLGLVHALSALSMICFFGGRAELWKPFYDALDRLEPHVPRSLRLISETFADPARTSPAASAALDAALAGLANEADPTAVVQVAFTAGTIDRLAPARPALLRVVQIGREVGAAGLVIQAQVLLALDSYWSGLWDDAIARADEVVELCQVHRFPLFAISAHHVHAAVAASRGEEDALSQALRALTSWGTPRGAGLATQMEAHARSVEALGRGDYDGAYRWSARISPAGVLAAHVQFALWVLMDLVEGAVHTGRLAEASAHIHAVQEAGVASLSPRMALSVRAACAMAADDQDAPELFDEALATVDADQWPFYLGRVQLAYGQRLRRLRRPTDARVQLERALETFERLGAHPWQLRASAELRATGRSSLPAHRRPPRTSTPPPADLTPQERAIAELAATGLTNKQVGEQLYLSHRTVSGHLHRIFPKLGITSRAALRRALDQHDAGASTHPQGDVPDPTS
ncbi:ATP-binding protein [Angustibacter sp. McL0619]|uniref:ATP-binding protein n=1 Tax=Angustibacter sp. McL0619 TaxID=3415676 RepID=UPI003CE92C30